MLLAWIRAREAATGYLATHNAMKWLLSILRALLILDRVTRPKKTATPDGDRGRVRAIVAEPGTLAGPEQLATSSTGSATGDAQHFVVHMSSPELG